MSHITTIGFDLAKNVFQVHGARAMFGHRVMAMPPAYGKGERTPRMPKRFARPRPGRACSSSL